MIRATKSQMTIVPRDGIPWEPLKTSLKLGRLESEAVLEGGTNVRVAKSRWMTVRTVEGSWSNMMRMATTSQTGHEDMMVIAVEAEDEDL